MDEKTTFKTWTIRDIDGDTIAIDIPGRKLALQVSEEVLAQRAEHLEMVRREASRFLRLYARHTASAATGAIRTGLE